MFRRSLQSRAVEPQVIEVRVQRLREKYGYLDWDVKELLICELLRDRGVDYEVARVWYEKNPDIEIREFARLETEPPPIMVVVHEGYGVRYKLVDGYRRLMARAWREQAGIGKRTIRAFVAVVQELPSWKDGKPAISFAPYL